ncbi:hypothetical protein TrST_g1891 [Triparma strigata]|uniref:Uncharacterized protein n=1 Tax=Triparma strigata TaxID=1606541 RepID=A0A9W7ETR8_9STRA|nr:hypothetical protein TrST_g1891 [Triparma strigata]
MHSVSSRSSDYASALRLAAEGAVSDFQTRTASITSERRRNILALSFTSLTLFTVLFGKAAYASFNSTSAEIISDVVAHESVSLQTQELAAAVVSHVLNDPEVLGKASKFLQLAAEEEETKKALSSIIGAILRSPERYKIPLLMKPLIH